MKKWEQPKIYNLSLEETRTIGMICPDCNANAQARGEQIICWKCSCCDTYFHQSTTGVDYFDHYVNPEQKCLEHEQKVHGGICS